jgi:hypothetical protein
MTVNIQGVEVNTREQNNATVLDNWQSFSVSVQTELNFKIIITFFGDGGWVTTGSIRNISYSRQQCPNLTTTAALKTSSTPTTTQTSETTSTPAQSQSGTTLLNNPETSSSIAGAIAAAVVVFVVIVIVLIVVIVLYRRGKLQFLKTLPCLSSASATRCRDRFNSESRR